MITSIVNNSAAGIAVTMDRTAWELGERDYNILAIGICFITVGAVVNQDVAPRTIAGGVPAKPVKFIKSI